MFISALPSVYFTRQTVTLSNGRHSAGVKGCGPTPPRSSARLQLATAQRRGSVDYCVWRQSTELETLCSRQPGQCGDQIRAALEYGLEIVALPSQLIGHHADQGDGALVALRVCHGHRIKARLGAREPAKYRWRDRVQA